LIWPICNVLPIAPSTYRKHVAQRRDTTRLSARAQRDLFLKPEVARVFAENFAVYGVRKVWRQMQREGYNIARCTVERLMRDMGLAGVIRGKPVRTTFCERRLAHWIMSIASSMHRHRTGCGYRTLLMSRPGAGSSTWRS
jgi:transposase InsO family protein